MPTIRIRYAKMAGLRFTSHLDVARTLRRALNRAKIPVAYSQGHVPRPKISLGIPLALGHTSTAEYADFEMTIALSPQRVVERLNKAMPEGLEVLHARRLHAGEPSLSSQISEMAYEVTIPVDEPEISEHLGKLDTVRAAIDTFSARDQVQISRERKGKVQRFDLKEYVAGLTASSADGANELRLVVSVSEKGYPRPEEILCNVFGVSERELMYCSIERTEVKFRGQEK